MTLLKEIITAQNFDTNFDTEYELKVYNCFLNIFQNWPDEKERKKLIDHFLKDPDVLVAPWSVGDRFTKGDSKTEYMICDSGLPSGFFLIRYTGKDKGQAATGNFSTIHNLMKFASFLHNENINPIVEPDKKAGENADSN